MMIRTTCPTDDELRSFGTGRLSGDAVDQVAEHVEACVDCVATISHDGSGSSVSMDSGKRYARRLAGRYLLTGSSCWQNWATDRSGTSSRLATQNSTASSR